MTLAQCYIPDGITVDECSIRSLNLSGSYFPDLQAMTAQINGNVKLDRSSATYINFARTTINGWLSINGANIINAEETAFSGDGLVVGGGLFCRNKARVVGMFRLLGAQIEGTLIFEDVYFSNEDIAFSADGMTVNGDLSCRRARVSGEFRMPGCTISGDLILSGSNFANGSKNAFVADNINVGHRMICDEGFNVKGIMNIHGAKLGGRLDLDDTTLSNPGSYSLIAADVRIAGDLSCQGMHAQGTVALNGASVSGRAIFNGARLSNAGDVALSAERLTVEGGFYGNKLFRAEGSISLAGARIMGQLVLDGACLINPNANALVADQIEIIGDMLAREGFRCEGSVRMNGGHIYGQLNFDNAELSRAGGVALSGDALAVDQAMFCQNGFTVQGEVKLIGAHISGQLSFNGARLINTQCSALVCDQLTVTGNMHCCDGFQAEGLVSFVGARISGQLLFLDSILRNSTGIALQCQNMKAETFVLRTAPISGIVDLRFAEVDMIWDDPTAWPCRLFLDGLIYRDIKPHLPSTGKIGRLMWLARNVDGYMPQPYEQIAAHYRRLGDDRSAKRVLLESERLRFKESRLEARILGRLLDVLVGYGFRPGLAFFWFVCLWIGASIYFVFNKPLPIWPAHHPSYDAFVYAANVVTPLIDFGQSNTWYDTGASQIVSVIFVAAGWVLATAFIAGATRMLTRK
jgi:hypothetical protein